MTTYEKIRQIRNKAFPPKLEDGCEIKNNKGEIGMIVEKYVNNDNLLTIGTNHFVGRYETKKQALSERKKYLKAIYKLIK